MKLLPWYNMFCNYTYLLYSTILTYCTVLYLPIVHLFDLSVCLSVSNNRQNGCPEHARFLWQLTCHGPREGLRTSSMNKGSRKKCRHITFENAPI